MMYRITAPHFVAGIEVNDELLVVKAAPIVRYMCGWHLGTAKTYCFQKGWDCEAVS